MERQECESARRPACIISAPVFCYCTLMQSRQKCLLLGLFVVLVGALLVFIGRPLFSETVYAIGEAGDVEITVELDSIWRSETKTNHHNKTARCIVGSKDWFISGNFAKNAKTDYWLKGTNVIEQESSPAACICNKSMMFCQKRFCDRECPHEYSALTQFQAKLL